MNINISKEEILKTLNKWGASHLITQAEEYLGRELNEDDYKKILLSCLGLMSDVSDMVDSLK